MKKVPKFKEGDKIFAKLKGYPAWPAEVTSKSGKKFSVQFYGTGEKGFVKPEEMFYYNKHKETMAKASKKKDFKEAIEEIEKAVEEAGGDDGDDGTVEEEVVTGAKRKRSNSDRSNESQPNKKPGRKSPDSDKDEVSMSSENISLKQEPEDSMDVDNEKEDGEGGGGGGAEGEDAQNAEGEEEGEEDDEGEDEMFAMTDLKVVSEQNLKHWIIYSDYVKENPDLYKSRPVDERGYAEHQSFPIKLPSGQWAAVKIHKTWPVSFENEFDCAMYDYDQAARILLMLDALNKGEITPETDPDTFLKDFKLQEHEIRRDIEMKLINGKYRRIERLRNESKLIEMDAKIKNALGLNKAEPKKALLLLDTMLGLEYDQIMLKKHSHVVDMIRRLRKYVGNVQEWNLSPADLETFNEDAQKVREKAEEVYKKMKEIVTIPPEYTNFWEGFNIVVTRFKEDCRGLSNREVFCLCAEPYSRQAIIDRLEQSEDLEEPEITPPEDQKTAVEVTPAEVTEVKPIIVPGLVPAPAPESTAEQ